MSILDDLLGKEPEQRTVEFCMDRELTRRLSEAQLDLEKAKRAEGGVRSNDRDKTSAARAAVEDLEVRVSDLVAEVQGRLIRFTFAALDPQEFDRLKGEHRPTEKQRTDARKNDTQIPDFNLDTFPPVFVAAACVKVQTPSGSQDGLSVDAAEAMWVSRSYNDAERAELFNTALNATVTRTRIDLPKGG